MKPIVGTGVIVLLAWFCSGGDRDMTVATIAIAALYAAGVANTRITTLAADAKERA